MVGTHSFGANFFGPNMFGANLFGSLGQFILLLSFGNRLEMNFGIDPTTIGKALTVLCLLTLFQNIANFRRLKKVFVHKVKLGCYSNLRPHFETKIPQTLLVMCIMKTHA